MVAPHNPPAATEPSLTIRRTFPVSPDALFAAWTNPLHLAHWWGPTGFQVVDHTMDVRPGGTYRITMRGPQGDVYTSVGTYREVSPPERLVFTFAWEETPPHETLVTITFKATAAGTEMHFHQAVFRNDASRDSHREGWSECFDRLAEFVAASR